MKLIADSGATKTLWYSLNASSTASCHTQGCHPYYWTTAELTKSLQAQLLPQLMEKKVEQLYFYGAGCTQAAPRSIVEEALKVLFPTTRIEVKSDLLAAARATAQHQAGVCCILGTGAASLQYDGHKMIDQVPSLGYLLGDEGSGADLGRQLLRAYYYRQFPTVLKAAFEEQYQTNKYEVIQALQQAEQPSRHLARYTQFAVEQQAHPFIQELIKTRFGVFLERQVSPYQGIETQPIHFVGSVAHGFQELLREVIEAKKWTMGTVLKSPFPALLSYHQ
ncbi:MAG: hypothetical protein ACRBFS_18410 [Aureispira sp.]